MALFSHQKVVWAFPDVIKGDGHFPHISIIKINLGKMGQAINGDTAIL
jgi:hypothetical protein